jgi:hypothetical protein
MFVFYHDVTPKYYYFNPTKLYKFPNILMLFAQNGLLNLHLRLIPVQIERFRMPKHGLRKRFISLKQKNFTSIGHKHIYKSSPAIGR